MSATTDSSPQLMQLRQPEAFRVLNQYHRRIWNIDTHLDHGRADQYLGFAAAKSFHDPLLVGAGDSAVQQFTSKWMQALPPLFVLHGRRFRIEFIALFD